MRGGGGACSAVGPAAKGAVENNAVGGLSQACYDRGVDSYLTLLDAQRTLYGAQQSLISTRLAQAANRVVLYSALGGGADR